MIYNGDTLYSRSCHTAVLSPDGHVIYGGGNPSGPTNQENQDQNLAVLDTTVSPYQWSIKPMIGDIPPTIAYHSAEIIENFMIIAF
ncbi:30187_t:CDS:2, partial [Gigaspora margarita]